MSQTTRPCALCIEDGGEILWQGKHCRVVRVSDPHYPGFCRVIWNTHVREMTDLESEQQYLLMQIVFAVEKVVREYFAPDKINLASFGNVVPHLHWHVIPRWRDDRHFPEPIWGKVQRESPITLPEVASTQLVAALAQALAHLKG